MRVAELARAPSLIERIPPRLGLLLGNLESRGLGLENPSPDRVRAPIFVGGLARSGSTKLVELLDMSGAFASMRYRDRGGIFFPTWWRKATPGAASVSVRMERSHGDDIFVTPDSPEAFEEPIWRAFLSASGQHLEAMEAGMAPAGLEAFYRAHVAKISALEAGRRYLTKGNYNTLRIPLLATWFPDAKFIIPVREPAAQVRSLLRQHRLFEMAAHFNPLVGLELDRIGHNEFGPKRLAFNAGGGRVNAVREAFSSGNDVIGYALEWAELYGFVDALMATMGHRILIVRHEDLVRDPDVVLSRVSEFLDEPGLDGNWMVRAASEVVAPGRTSANPSDAVVTEVVGDVARRFGYE